MVTRKEGEIEVPGEKKIPNNWERKEIGLVIKGECNAKKGFVFFFGGE